MNCENCGKTITGKFHNTEDDYFLCDRCYMGLIKDESVVSIRPSAEKISIGETALALLHECLANGEISGESLYAWFTGERDLIKSILHS